MPIGGDKVGTGYVPIKPDTQGFGSELEAGLDKEGTPAASRAGGKMSAAMKGAFLGGIALLGKSAMDFANFEGSMNEVFTLLPGITDQAMGEMTKDVKDFAVEFAVLPTEVVPALYSSLSAGVPPDNVFAFLETAQKLAKGGVTELETAVDGLSSVVNAYGSEVLGAETASDLMFTAVKLGKTTVDELSSSLFQVTPTAAALGVKFEDITAALAGMTAQGVPTSVATTQLRQLFVELSKEGSKTSDVFQELSGKTFKEFIAEGGNTQGALQLLEAHAADSGIAINDLFGSVEAGAAALSLTGANAETFTNNLTAMQDSAGATDAAFETMNQGLGVTLDRLKARFSVILLNIGESIAPTLGTIGEGLALLLEMFGKLPGPMQAVAVLLGTITAGLFAFAGPILKGIQLFKALGGVMTLLAANPWILVLAGLVAITFLIIKNWDSVKAALSATWAWMVEAGTAVGEFFTGLWTSVTDTVTEKWNLLTEGFRLGLDSIKQWFVDLGGTIGGVWASIRGAGESAIGWLLGIPGAITGAFSNLAGIISAPFQAAFGAIKTGWNSTVGGFGFKTPDWLPGLGGKSFTIPSMATGSVVSTPTLALVGDAGAGNPEIVAPQNLIRQTMIEAIASVGGMDTGGSSGGLVVNGPLIGEATIRDTRDITELSRELAREIERRQRGAGRRAGGVSTAA